MSFFEGFIGSVEDSHGGDSHLIDLGMCGEVWSFGRRGGIKPYLAFNVFHLPTVEGDIGNDEASRSACRVHIPGGDEDIVAIEDVMLD